MKLSVSLVVGKDNIVTYSDKWEVIFESDAVAAEAEGLLQLAKRLERHARALTALNKANKNR